MARLRGRARRKALRVSRRVPPVTRLSPGELIALGLLTLWPLLYVGVFFALMASGISTYVRQGNSNPPEFGLIVFLAFLTAAESFAMTVYYTLNVYREPAIQGDRKILWMAIVFVGGSIGQAIYYVLWLVRRDPRLAGASAGGPSNGLRYPGVRASESRVTPANQGVERTPSALD